jgi:hypothetical protein
MPLLGEMNLEKAPAHIRDALALRWGGRTWREVARLMGKKDHSTLYHECRTWDAAARGDERFKALTAQAIEIAMEAGAQVMEALQNGEVSPKMLPILYGISVDKFDRLTRAERAPEVHPVAHLLAAFHGAGGAGAKLTATIELTPPTPLVIDVPAR